MSVTAEGHRERSSAQGTAGAAPTLVPSLGVMLDPSLRKDRPAAVGPHPQAAMPLAAVSQQSFLAFFWCPE